jgi:hypothetical protein
MSLARQKELDSLDEKRDREIQEARQNRDFTQTYPEGWERIRQLATGNPGAITLYSFIAQHIDANCGAVIADQTFLSEQLGVSRRTIIRWIAYLEEQGAMLKIPIAGKVCAYALNPSEVWKGYNSSKDYAAFVTKTLVNQDGEIRRKLKAMLSKKQ